MIYISSLGYSFHLSNDKNKKNSSKASAKSNISGQHLKAIVPSKMQQDYQNVTTIIAENMMIESMILKLFEGLIPL